MGGIRGDFQISNGATANRNLYGKSKRFLGDEDRLTKNFIWAHNHWVDKRLLEQLNVGDKEAIQVALDQIHQRSILESKREDRKSYRSVLVEDKDHVERPSGSVGSFHNTDMEDESWQKVEVGDSSRCNMNDVSSVRENNDVHKAYAQAEEVVNNLQIKEKSISQAVKSGVLSVSSPSSSIPKLHLKARFRKYSTSTEPSSDNNPQEEASSKSDICEPERILSLQTDLCKDVSRKLKVKSNRGRPKKVSNVLRNPFEIGIKFKGRKKKMLSGRIGGKTCGRSRGKHKSDKSLQLVPIGLSGKSVQEALEIISSAENMGLLIKGDKAEAVKAIARKLEEGEL
ncbi:hypothetical protein ACET3Z_004841 [Daucus carota]